MYVRSLGFAILMATLLLPAGSYAQSSSPDTIADINATSYAPESIVVLHEENTDVPGYVHTQYVFVDLDCGPMLVDRYGPPINANDRALRQEEETACLNIAPGHPDGE